MTLSLTCKGCDKVITADNEEEMVAALQAHIVRDHNGAHSPTREQILARLHRQDHQTDVAG
jgi:predicted small metal-binding protein